MDEYGTGFCSTPPLVWVLLSGAMIGFVSGMIGIGGGIMLSPLILLMRWADMKETAAISHCLLL